MPPKPIVVIDPAALPTPAEVLELAAHNRRVQQDNFYSGDARNLTPQAFSEAVARAGGVEKFKAISGTNYFDLSTYERQLRNSLVARIARGELNPDGSPNPDYFENALRGFLPLVSKPNTTSAGATAVPPSPPVTPPTQSFIDPAQAKRDADIKRLQTQAYLAEVERVQNATNQQLLNFATQQGLLNADGLKRSDTAGLTDFQKTILAEINERVGGGVLAPGGKKVDQLARESGLTLGEVAAEALTLTAEKTAAATAGAVAAAAAASVTAQPVITTPGSYPGANPQLVVGPDGNYQPTRPGTLFPPDSGGTGILQPGRTLPPGAFPDEMFRRNPADP